MLFVEGVRLHQRRLVEKPRVFPVKNLWPEKAANLVVEHVAQYRRHNEYGKQHANVHATQCGQRTGDEKQRITG